jgi:tetratricopeptide (TPR) repeat protein
LQAGQKQSGSNLPRRDAILRQIEATVARGQPAEAARLAEDALAGGFEHPGLLNLVAFHCIQNDDCERALSLLQRARTLAPNDAHVLNGLGVAYKRLGRARDALGALDGAITADGGFVNAHFNRGTVLEAQGEMDAAKVAYERVAALEPGNDEALARLSYLAAMRGDYPAALNFGDRAIKRHLRATPPALKLAQFAILRGNHEAARAMAGEALKREPRNAFAEILVAQAELGLGDAGAARVRIERLLAGTLPAPLRALALWVAAEADDREANTREAFAGYVASKEETRRQFASEFTGPRVTSYRDLVERSIDYFRNAPGEAWERGTEAPGPQPAFLLGFPRSGTTLLQQVLAAHPGFATAEEMNPFPAAVNEFFLAQDGWPRLAVLDEAGLARHRETYWRIVRRAVPALEDRSYLDKNPLRTTFLPIVSKLFPGAKILFSVRDPRDVVLSCLRQQFTLSLPMYEFCTLEGSARLYDAVMRLYAVYREKLPLNVLEVRHEDLVADFDGATQRICAFLGVDPHPAMRDVAATTRAHLIKTPSAAQVARGLYAGEARWRRYKDELAPVMTLLDPWVAHFGYPKE